MSDCEEALNYVEEPAHDDCNPFGDGIENSTDCILPLDPPNGGFTFAPDSEEEEPEEEALPELPVEIVDIDDPGVVEEPEVPGTLSDLDDNENIVGDEFVGLAGDLDEDTVLSTEAVSSSAGFLSTRVGVKRPREEGKDSWSQDFGLD